MGIDRIIGHTVRVERKEFSAYTVYIISDVNPTDGLHQVGRLHQYCKQAMLKVSPLHDGSFTIDENEVEANIATGNLNQEYICSGIKEAALGKAAHRR